MTAAVLSVVLGACTAEAPPAAYDAEAVRADVTALIQRWSDAGEAGDWAAVADTYADAEGFAWIERGDVAYADHAAIVAGLESVQASEGSIVNDVSDIVVTPLGADAAAYRARYRLQVTTATFGYESNGVLSGVAINQDGTWRLLQGSFSEQPQAH
ncbi:MAG: nuclear transport factor 2 family protein [Hyphomonadaceae bacterium]